MKFALKNLWVRDSNYVSLSRLRTIYLLIYLAIGLAILALLKG